MTTCNIVDSLSGACPNEATRHVITGCVHEHISDDPVCEFHLPTLTDNVEPVYCLYCYEQDGHRCVVSAA